MIQIWQKKWKKCVTLISLNLKAGAAEDFRDWVHSLLLRPKFWVRKTITFSISSQDIGCANVHPCALVSAAPAQGCSGVRRTSLELVLLSTTMRFKRCYSSKISLKRAFLLQFCWQQSLGTHNKNCYIYDPLNDAMI